MFEQYVKELETITTRLEKDDLPLETAVDLFRQGMELSQKCHSILSQSETKILTLMNNEVQEIKIDEEAR